MIDRVQLVRRCLVLRARTLEVRVEPVDLCENALRLRTLRVDRRVAGRHACYDTSRSESDDDYQRLSLMSVDKGLPPLAATGAPGGAGTSQVPEASRGIG